MISEEDVLGYFTSLSNWGRWGSDDVLGTLNFIDDGKRVEAAGLVRDGVCISCAWDIRPGAGAGSHVPAQRYMIGTGLGIDDPGRKGLLDAGRFASAVEFVGYVFHGLQITHLDTLAHVFWDGRMYNGRPASLVSDWAGAATEDAVVVRDGIVTRGVLLDVAAAHGVDALEPGTPVMPDDLERAEQTVGVTVGRGDALLLRTGDGARRRAQRGDWDPTGPRPGFHAGCLPWLHERSVALIAADVAQDVVPSGVPSISLPVHSVGMVAMGLWLVDNCQLEDLSAHCHRTGRWDFQFVVAPIPFKGATGSAVNPLALF